MECFLYNFKMKNVGKRASVIFLGTAVSCLTVANRSYAQQAYSSGEDDIQDVFVAGAYGALFGSAMGIAFLPFITDAPFDNMRIVAGGASIGFMLGSGYAMYNVGKYKKSSYFNYSPEGEENYFYSMPPTIPNHGNLRMKPKQENLQAQEKKLPKVGALVVSEGTHFGFAMPVIWVGKNNFGFTVASLKF